ncbi:MAG: PVC-type heme-binding CxxCH protein [Planctomycetota bacterium]|nr:PVC-type heme-binding CxxCH protein [Planctomycetota bacterium]
MAKVRRKHWNCLKLSFLGFLSSLWVIASSLPAQDSAANNPESNRSRALLPSESLRSIQLSRFFSENESLELLAHEPAVVDPVDAVFDELGRLWVVEMRDYPMLAADGTPQGQIRILADEDSDGLFETSSVFAGELNMPTGLAIWKDGAVVTVAGELLFLRDTNGDGVCDTREQWLRGFAERNEQLRANHPTLGADGWWYIACGLRGGRVELGSDIQPANSAQKPLEIGSRDIRFKPETGEIEAITGPAQFGLAFDELGNRFFCSNRNPAVQVLLESPQLSNNPLAGILPPKKDVIPAGTDSQVFPIVSAWTTSNLHAGQFTAACGVIFQQSAEGAGDFFVCEPTGSLVKRVRGSRNTVSGIYSTQDLLAPQQKDWVASSDAWFRPVNLRNAPGGGLLVIDMHRAVIEHPQWVPDELKQREDERWGNAAGRIYLAGSQAAGEFSKRLQRIRELKLAEANADQLCELLASEDCWLVETVRRMLLLSADENLAAVLEGIVLDSEKSLSQRMECLKVLSAKGGAHRACERLLVAEETTASLSALVLRQVALGNCDVPLGILQGVLQKHSDPVVLRESLACLATHEMSALSQSTLDRIADSGSPYLLILAAGALRDHPDRLLAPWVMSLESTRTRWHDHLDFLQQASGRLTQVCSTIKLPSLRRQLVLSWEQSESVRVQVSLLAAFNVMLHRDRKATLMDLASVLPRIVEIADGISKGRQRELALQLLAATQFEEYWSRFQQLYRLAKTVAEQTMILEVWLQSGDRKAEETLVALLDSSDHRLVSAAVELSLSTQDRVQVIAHRVSETPGLARKLGPANLGRLKSRARGDSAKVFSKAIADLVDSDRARVITRYRDTLSVSADALHGKSVFQRQCASCHRIGDVGFNVGPDISDSRTKTSEQLLVSILDPNRAIDNNYFRVTILTDSDKVIDGVVIDEQADYITLRQKEGREVPVLRSEIVRQQSTGVSLMPEGMEAQITPKAMADLIAYIKNWRYASGEIPGLR